MCIILDSYYIVMKVKSFKLQVYKIQAKVGYGAKTLVTFSQCPSWALRHVKFMVNYREINE